MKLKGVEIVNYRSIEKIIIPIDNECKIFVGRSETGKSNILHALSTLDELYKTNSEDVRADIGRGEQAYIKFKFGLTDDDISIISNDIVPIILGINDEELFYLDNKNIEISNYIDRDYYYNVDIRNNKRNFSYEKLDKYQINDNYKIIRATSDKNIEIVNKQNQEITNLTELTIVNSNLYEISTEGISFENINVDELRTLIIKKVTNFIANNKTRVLFWDYDKQNILPSNIDINQFIEDPNICIPLKKIFELSGITDIKGEYNDWISRGAYGLDNKLDKLSETITEYFKNVWKELSKDTSITITASETKFKIAIKDAINKYDMKDRSDGYKRLVTFLIMISIDNKNNKLKNTLVLIDEPECKIDIPGQRYLKNEILNIGKSNYVFYSTHSPYMIDSLNTSRHYLVNKNNEITTIKIADENDYHDCNALFDSLGTSVFENIGDYNIALEGWTDKILLTTATNSTTSSRKTKLDKIHLCHLGGVKSSKTFASTWGIICRTNRFLIISDNDEIALNTRNTYYDEHLQDYGEWITYKELANFDRKIETVEDFLKPQYIKDICDNFANEIEINKISIDTLTNNGVSKISAISNWLKANNYSGKGLEDARKDIKNRLYNNLANNFITPDYKNILDGIIKLTIEGISKKELIEANNMELQENK